MSQLTLVALYRRKPRPLDALIRQCMAVASEKLGELFTPYSVEQVHATIAGMERVPIAGVDDVYLNRNAHLLYDRRIEMSYDQLRDAAIPHLPMTIRWGGYNPSDVPFDGLSVVPFRRSVYFNRSTGKLVLIGWPHRGGDFSRPILLRLRNELQQTCGLIHKYRNDNDFFQVLGSLNAPPTGSKSIELSIDNAQKQLVELLNDTRIDVDVSADELQICCYRDTSLPTESTHAVPFTSTHLTTSYLKALYSCDSEKLAKGEDS